MTSPTNLPRRLPLAGVLIGLALFASFSPPLNEASATTTRCSWGSLPVSEGAVILTASYIGANDQGHVLNDDSLFMRMTVLCGPDSELAYQIENLDGQRVAAREIIEGGYLDNLSSVADRIGPSGTAGSCSVTRTQVACPSFLSFNEAINTRFAVEGQSLAFQPAFYFTALSGAGTAINYVGFTDPIGERLVLASVQRDIVFMAGFGARNPNTGQPAYTFVTRDQ